MKYEERLKQMGFQVPQAAAPVANYAMGIVDGRLLYISGQLPMADGNLAYKGKLGKDCSIEDGYAAARLCALNCMGIIKAMAGNLDYVEKIIKITGFVNSTEDFTDQPKVVNGASDILKQVFGELGIHARSAVGAASLPLGACCEVEMIVRLRDKLE